MDGQAKGVEEIICYTPHISKGNQKKLSFMDIFLNDQWAECSIQCPESVYDEIGNINNLLLQKQNYEFLLRVARLYPIKAVGATPSYFPTNGLMRDVPRYNWECFQTDCYIVSKYQQELLKYECYYSRIEELVAHAMRLPCPEEGISWLRKMITHSEEYWKIDDNTGSILIYRGDEMVAKVLLSFTDELIMSFRKCHQKVEVFDYRQNDMNELTKYMGRRFKAIIGIQSTYFSIQTNGIYLHDLIIGPKYNMILDHPVFLKELITNGPKDYFLLTHDRNYINFVNHYYKDYITDCFQLAPAGILPSVSRQPFDKIYDISFIGTYQDYRQGLADLYKKNVWTRHLAARCLRFLKECPNITVEMALEKTLYFYKIQIDEKKFEELFYNFRYLTTVIAYYFREKVMATLLDAGITVHVFGDTWYKSPFVGYPNCILHSHLTTYESIEIFQKSKISLNIMKWHKDGFTERIANSLLCQSLVLSDKSQYLEENFISGKELVLYDLSELEALPSIVNNLLSDSALLEDIVANGYRKAIKQHLWIHRAEQILNIIDNEDFR